MAQGEKQAALRARMPTGGSRTTRAGKTSKRLVRIDPDQMVIRVCSNPPAPSFTLPRANSGSTLNLEKF
jgi:hypothetical protein